MLEQYKGYISAVGRKKLTIEATLVGGNDIRYLIEIPKNTIREKQKNRIQLGRFVKVGITNKGKLSVFLFPDMKWTKKEIKEIETRAKEWASKIKWE